jgi:hypothetical protein
MVPIPGKEKEMERNYAGGYCFTVTDEVALCRLMMLGTANGSYHATGTQLTRDQLGRLNTVLARGFETPFGGKWCVDLVRSILRDGRCAKRVYAMMVISQIILTADAKTVAYCRAHLREMISIPTDLFTLVGFVDKWGRGQKRAIAEWFRLSRDGSPRTGRSLAYLCFKYFQRGGWSVLDLLRLCHLKPKDCSLAQQIVLKCVVKGWDETVTFVKAQAQVLVDAKAKAEAEAKADAWVDVAEVGVKITGVKLVPTMQAPKVSKVDGLAIDGDLKSALQTFESEGSPLSLDVVNTMTFLAGVALHRLPHLVKQGFGFHYS